MNNSNKTHWQTVFNYEYLKPGHFTEEDKVLTIKEATLKLLKNRQNPKGSEKLCLFFEEIETGLVMNVTNCQILSDITKSPNLEDWKGKTINLYVTKVNFKGGITDGIRIRPFLAYDMDQAKAELKKKNNRSEILEFLKLVPHLYIDSEFQDDIRERLLEVEPKQNPKTE